MGTRWSNATGWRLAHLVVASIALANGGCLVAAIGGAAAAGGVAGYAYYKGGLVQEFNASLDDSWAAAKTALQELGLPLLAEKREKDGGVLDSRMGDGETVRIALESKPARLPAEGPLTDVSVRVGLFGDRPLSERILTQVGAHLAPVRPVAASAPGAPLVPVPHETAPPPLGRPEPIPSSASAPSRPAGSLLPSSP
jgi:hypothetical protein